MTGADLNNDSRLEPVGTASQMLAQAREAKGLSQKAVAEQLFLSETFIRYIDDGDFHKLPKPVFIKGYLRSYAKAVSLDSAAVIAAYERDQNIAPQLPQIGQVTDETVGSGAFTGPVLQTGMIGLGLVLIVAAAVLWIGGDNGKAPPTVMGNDTTALSQTPSAQLPQRVDSSGLNESDAGQKASEPSVDAAPIAPDNTGPAARSAGSTDSTKSADATEGTTETTGGAATGSAAVAPAVAASSNQTAKANGVQIDRQKNGEKEVITVNAGGTDKMSFLFTDECWVEITDGRGERIYGDLNRAGDVMTVYGIAPFDVLLGKAPAVSMTWQGEQVDLARYTTKDQTARIRTARL